MIIFCEVMFDKHTSGELPEHIRFIKEKCIPTFSKWGYKTEILRAEKTYIDCFNHVLERSKYPERIGKKAGFPMAGKCWANRDLKIKPINDFFKNKDPNKITQYIGIAADEPKRLKRLKTGQTKKVSLLEKYGYTEKMALDLCEKYDLLSPIYDFAPRGGCWFCPNAGYSELKHLRTFHRNLWDRLLALEKEPDIVGNMWNTLIKRRMADNEEMFMWEEAQMDIFDYITEG